MYSIEHFPRCARPVLRKLLRKNGGGHLIENDFLGEMLGLQGPVFLLRKLIVYWNFSPLFSPFS